MDDLSQKFRINSFNDVTSQYDDLKISIIPDITSEYLALLNNQLHSPDQNNQLNALAAYQVIGSRGEFNQKCYSTDFYELLIKLAFDQNISHPVHISSIYLISNLILLYPWTSVFFFQEKLHLLSLYYLCIWADSEFSIKLPFTSLLSFEDQQFLQEKNYKETDLPPETLSLILDSIAGCNQEYYRTITDLHYLHLLLLILDYYLSKNQESANKKSQKILSWIITSIQHLIVQPWITFEVPLPNLCQAAIILLQSNSPPIITASLSILALCALPDKVPNNAIIQQTVSKAIQIFNNPPSFDCAQSATEFLCNVLFFSNPDAKSMIISENIPANAAFFFY